LGRMIAPFWDDLYPPGGGGIYYSLTGSAPNRVFTVEWRNIEHFPVSYRSLPRSVHGPTLSQQRISVPCYSPRLAGT